MQLHNFRSYFLQLLESIGAVVRNAKSLFLPVQQGQAKVLDQQHL
jgi:hypothetical protein